MTVVVVEGVLSRRDFGTIFAARVQDTTSERHGERFRVRASRAAMVGEPGVGETWRVDGRVTRGPHGPQVEATHAIRVSATGTLVRDFLARHVSGVGDDRAMRLWAAFGTDLPRVLEAGEVDAVSDVIAPDRPLLAPRLAIACIAAWQEAASEARLVEWLGAVGVDDLRLVRRVHAVLGERAIPQLCTNPWCLVPLLPWPKVDGLGLKLLREASAKLVETAPDRLVGAVDSAMRDVIAMGSTSITRADLSARVASKLALPEAAGSVADALSLGRRHSAVVVHDDRWRAPGCALMEEAVVSRLRSIRDARNGRFGQGGTVSDAIADFERRQGALHPEQRAAVAAIMRSPLSCLQGGAGTGKTFVTRAVCDVWERGGGNVLLAAVAGKAALRLSRSTGRLARTLFRTIRQIEEQQGGDEPMPACGDLARVDADTLVIVDEASMVDLGSMHALLRLIPEGARLLLVGDERQLPPVGMGLIFHRLVTDDAITARLRTVHRQAETSGIPAFAGAVRSRSLPSLPAFGGRASGVTILTAATSEEVAATTVRTAVALGILDGEDVMVVTPVNAGAAGTTALNVRLHDLRRERGGVPEVRGVMGARFSVGEPVLFRRNDYRRALFNGSLGMVVSLDEASRSFVATIDDVEHTFGAADMVDVSLGYALTCHRAQGSQAKRVVVAVPPSRLLDPSWLYTAVTRAEQQVVLVGTEETLRGTLAAPWASDQRSVGFAWRGSTFTQESKMVVP